MNTKRIENAKKLYNDMLAYLHANDFEIYECNDVYCAQDLARPSASSYKAVKVAKTEFILNLDIGGGTTI